MADNYLISVYFAESSEIGKDENVKLFRQDDLQTYVTDLDNDFTVDSFLQQLKKDVAGDPLCNGDDIMEVYFNESSLDPGNFGFIGTTMHYLIGTIDKVLPNGDSERLFTFRTIPYAIAIQIKDRDKDIQTWEDLFLSYRTNFDFTMDNVDVVLSTEGVTLQDLKDVGQGSFDHFTWICVNETGPFESYLQDFIHNLI